MVEPNRLRRCDMGTTKHEKKKENMKKTETEFSLVAPQAGSVFLSGDFNLWNHSSHPLKKGKDGKWKISLPLSPGPYQYRFLVDGKWQNDPSSLECVANPFGTLNCLTCVK
jgi:1,4-alpha-glucan branching enzyme